MKQLLIILFVASIDCAHGQSVLEKGKKLYEEKKLSGAQKLLSTIDESHKDYSGAQYYLGRIAFDEGRFEDATDYLEEAIDNNGNVAEYQNWYGNALGTVARDANVVRQGMLAPKIKTAWERAVELSPQYIEPRQSLIQFYLQAPGFMGGSIDKAKEMAKQIMKLKPAEGHRQLGNIFVTEGKIADAEKEFLAMTKADPSLTSTLVNFYVNQKQFDKAFVIVDETLRKNPADMLAAYQYGKISALSGQRMDQGEQYLKKYVGNYTPQPSEPSHAGANMRLAQIHEKKGNRIEAKKLYENALKLDKNMKEAKEGLERVSK